MTASVILRLAVLGPLCLLWGLRAPAAEVPLSQRLALLSGDRLAGKLNAFSPQGKLEFEMAGGSKREIALPELVQFGMQREMVRGKCVLLADGSLLAAREVHVASGGVWIETDGLGTKASPRARAMLKVPLEKVRAVLFQLPGGARERDLLLDRLRDDRGDEDRLLLENGDVVAGTLHLGADAEPEPGREKAGAALIVETRASGKTQRVEVPERRVAALRFNPNLVQAPKTPAAFELGLSDGSLLQLAGLGEVADGTVRELTFAGGLVAPVTPDFDLPLETVLLRPAQSRVLWLADSPPVAYRHWPFLSTEWPLARGRNVLGGRMRIGGFLEARGLGMHSRSRAIFDVPEGAKRFEAEAAVDDAAGRRGSVIYRVLVLRGQAWSAAVDSPLVRGGDQPVALSVDVAGAQQIALIVEFGDRGDECDWANWLGARFVK